MHLFYAAAWWWGGVGGDGAVDFGNPGAVAALVVEDVPILLSTHRAIDLTDGTKRGLVVRVAIEQP